MNPELLKQLQAMIAQFRNAAVGPTDKLTQPFANFGKGQGEFGMDMARNINAIAHSTNAHPAPKNAGLNTILGIGSLFVPGLEGEGAAERPALAAAIKTPEGKIVDDVTHAHAYMKAGITEPLKPKFEGFTDKNIPNSFYTRQQAEKLMKSWTSQSVKNQMATRSQQAGRDMGMTTEDVNGKLYANRGTRADEPMTLDDMNRIMRNKKRREGRASLDSAVVHPLADLVRKEGKVGQLGDNDVVIDFRGKKYYGSDGQTSAYQDALSKIPHELPGPRRTMLQPGEPVPPFWGTRLHSQLTQDGGFTIDPTTGENLASGYSVGGGNKAGILLKKPLADLKPTEIQDFLNQNKSKLAPGQAWGGWVDNGHVYIEPADQVADRAAATKLGQQRGEKAIWDHANKSEIPTQDEAPRAAMDSVAIPAAREFHHVLTKWQSAFKDFNALGAEVHAEPNLRRSELADALRNPVTPQAPWLAKYAQHDIPRPTGAAAKAGDVEELAYKAFKGPQFRKWLEAGRGMGSWYDTRGVMGQAVDALGDKLGPQAFNQFIDHLAASTAMSRPENNIRRASWWRALNLQGKLDPAELRTSALAAPEGMGHIANKAHHFATADLVQNGEINALGNPKPASFAENLKMNWKPITFDTRMATRTLDAQPKLSLGIAGNVDDATPRKWAYAPIERGAQAAAKELHQRGLVDAPPAGVDPTAAWQAQVWGGIGASDRNHMTSQFEGNFSDVLNRLLKRSADKWGVSMTKANELFWKGQPLDLPLDAGLLTGPARLRKK